MDPRIRNISIGCDGHPSAITIQMSADHAAKLVEILGALKNETGRTELTSDLYSCLNGELFNRFYEDGVDGYLREKGK